MARLHGRYATLEISVDNGTTWEDIGCLTDIDLDVTPELVEATCRDDGNGKFYLPGRLESEVNFSAQYDEEAVGQRRLWDILATDGDALMRYRPDPGSGNREIGARFAIDSFNVATPLDGPAEMSATIKLLGEVAFTFQA